MSAALIFPSRSPRSASLTKPQPGGDKLGCRLFSLFNTRELARGYAHFILNNNNKKKSSTTAGCRDTIDQIKDNNLNIIERSCQGIIAATDLNTACSDLFNRQTSVQLHTNKSKSIPFMALYMV